MNKKITALASLVSVFAISPSWGNTNDTYKDFKFEGNTIHAYVPEGWSALTGVINVPLTFLSEKGTQDTRAAISVVPFEESSDRDGFATLKKDPENFYDQKEKSIHESGGRSISYVPFKEEKKDGAKIYSIGIRYHLNDADILDKTFYVTSKNKQSYMIKVLMPSDLEKENEVAINKEVEAISARN